jgi:Nitrile hydratase beta subunit, N-terminal
VTVGLPETLPRQNGEPVFAAPWESRAFGLAAAYLGARGEDWARFRHRLMDAIAESGPGTPYYETWVTALERVLAADGLRVPPA